jgi:hypothetical protein
VNTVIAAWFLAVTLGWPVWFVARAIDGVAAALRDLADQARDVRWRISMTTTDDDEPDEPDEPDDPDEGEETMSWSISSRGKMADVRKAVGDQFDSSAVLYTSQGCREGNDLLALRGVVLGAIDTLKVDQDKEDVVVSCYGSRGEDSYMSCTLSVTKEAKAAPPAPPETKPEVASAK